MMRLVQPRLFDLPWNTIPFLHFNNVCGLSSIFRIVEHHLYFSRSHPLFLTEIQVSDCFDSKPNSPPSYRPYPQFLAKEWCTIYERNNVIYSSVSELDCSEFYTLLLWTHLPICKLFCSIHLSHNSTDQVKLFDFLNLNIEYILFPSPFSENIIWVIAMFTTNDIFPLILKVSKFQLNSLTVWCNSLTYSNRLWDIPSILDVFLISNYSSYIF